MLGELALGYIDKAYVNGADVSDTRLSPLFEDNLIELPPAYMLTCELDPLRDEGRAYADKMEANAVRVMRRHEKSMPHGFLNFAKAFPPGRVVPVEAGEFLRRQFV
jgi:acetyl esterase